MANTFTKTTSVSIFGRMKNAIVAVFIGILMIPGSIILMGWNEYRSVQTVRSLNDGLKMVHAEVDISKKNSDLDGTLIHFTETAKTDEELADADFGIRETAIRLERKIEMYQWKQHKESKSRTKVGGRKTTETTYTYQKVWESKIFDSSKYEKSDYRNPAPRYPAKHWTAGNVTTGAYQLSDSIISKIKKGEAIRLNQEIIDALPSDLKSKCVLDGDAIYYSENSPNPAEPKIGDLKIRFEVTGPQEISVVTAVNGDTFKKYKTKNGIMLELVQLGEVSADEMFQIAKDENTAQTWGLRFIGFVLAALGISLILGPLAVMMDVIPFLGSLARGGIFVVSVFGAVIISSFTIALSWIAVRPLIGIPMLLIGIGGIVGLVMWRKKSSPIPAAIKSDDAQVEVVG